MKGKRKELATIVALILSVLMTLAIMLLSGQPTKRVEALDSSGITDLTGTTWKFKDNFLLFNTDIIEYSINFTDAEGTGYTDLRYVRFGGNASINYVPLSGSQVVCCGLPIGGSIDPLNPEPPMPTPDYPTPTSNVYSNNTKSLLGGSESTKWYNEKYQKIHITGGTDVTNQSLITFLQTNATLTSIDSPSVPSTGFMLENNQAILITSCVVLTVAICGAVMLIAKKKKIA